MRIVRGTDLVSGLRKRGISVAQDIPERTQLVTVWSTGFCPGERSPETIFLRPGERLLAAAAAAFGKKGLLTADSFACVCFQKDHKLGVMHLNNI